MIVLGSSCVCVVPEEIAELAGDKKGEVAVVALDVLNDEDGDENEASVADAASLVLV